MFVVPGALSLPKTSSFPSYKDLWRGAYCRGMAERLPKTLSAIRNGGARPSVSQYARPPLIPASASRQVKSLLRWSRPSLSLVRSVRPNSVPSTTAQDHQRLVQQPIGVEVS